MKAISMVILLIFISTVNIVCSSKTKVDFRYDKKGKKIDVYIGNIFFTAFIYPDNLEKQVIYPIVSSSGKTITRGFPIEPKPFERTDRPHHVGLWFNFGDINGLDFWNNSFAVKPENKHRYGSIKFQEVVATNPQSGTLKTSSDWVNSKNDVLLTEISTFIFSEKNGIRSIERITELTANIQVVFTENKEGLLGLRMDRAFEEPADKPGRFLDAEGNVTEVPVLNNEGVNGIYRNAEGITGGEVWGQRSPWVALRAKKEGEMITVIIFDHPDNPNYPAWSHARGYGLFATNNLAGRAIDENANKVTMKLHPGEKVVFKHKVIIGGELPDSEINDRLKNFSNN